MLNGDTEIMVAGGGGETGGRRKAESGRCGCESDLAVGADEGGAQVESGAGGELVDEEGW